MRQSCFGSFRGTYTILGCENVSSSTSSSNNHSIYMHQLFLHCRLCINRKNCCKEGSLGWNNHIFYEKAGDSQSRWVKTISTRIQEINVLYTAHRSPTRQCIWEHYKDKRLTLIPTREASCGTWMDFTNVFQKSIPRDSWNSLCSWLKPVDYMFFQ